MLNGIIYEPRQYVENFSYLQLQIQYCDTDSRGIISAYCQLPSAALEEFRDVCIEKAGWEAASRGSSLVQSYQRQNGLIDFLWSRGTRVLTCG